MTITTGTMTDEQRVSVAKEFLLRLDLGGNTLELFDEDALPGHESALEPKAED